MDAELKKELGKIASTIKQLSIEAVQKANSGHPGLPLGCAEFGAFLYGYFLRHNPKNSKWLARDRFVLSAGHGSMLLYSCLHLAGFNLSLDEIKRFRQLHSKTPGHPEYGITEGVEATTGPLGQGVANAVGQALALKILGAKFNKGSFNLFDGKVVCLAGDGCIMEGISSEASSFAGHLNLNNLILVHDANNISLDGPLADSQSEDTKLRYQAYGFDVISLDGYDFDQMQTVFDSLRKEQKRPCFIEMKTIIGHGAPHKQGTHKVHGSPLGLEELAATKKALGLPDEEFYIPQSVQNYFAAKLPKEAELEKNWKDMLLRYKNSHAELFREFTAFVEQSMPANLEEILQQIPVKSPIAGRSASHAVIEEIAKIMPFVYGGSADLSSSDLTWIKDSAMIAPNHFEGRNIKYGVREFAMAGIASGLAESNMIRPFIGTFFTFSDYMRNAIRLAALSHTPVIYQFTHDSIFLGEDGPTHQSVEHLAALRAMPNLHVIRPADANEVKMAWKAALKYRGPTAIILSRQALPELAGTDLPFDQGVGKGAYILRKESMPLQYTLFATGSEVSLALDVAKALELRGKGARVISMPCWEIFEKQDKAYRTSIIGGDLGQRVSIEAGVSFGWHKWIGHEGITISVDTYGASAPASDLAIEYGFTVESILERIL